MSETHAVPLPIKRIGKYELQAEIGDGGMGRVFRARLHGPAMATREVAIKVLHSHLSDERDFILMFLDEMRLAMALSHRNIVQTFDAGAVDGRYYMVMELVEGCSLRGLLGRLPRPARLPVDIALFVGMEVCAALDHAHQFRLVGADDPMGVVHRDVSPSNILLSSQGDVKLTDFGVAKAAGRLTVTSVDSVKGKLAYMAPEQARGQVSPSSDLFALGAVMYELLGGFPIRPKRDLSSVRQGSPIPALLRRRRPEIPASLERLIMSCLETRPSNRPASAAELREALASERFKLELAQPVGPDGHARLRRYLAETPAAPPPAPGPELAARPAASNADALAQQLLRQAEEQPEVTLEPLPTSVTTVNSGAVTSEDPAERTLGDATTQRVESRPPAIPASEVTGLTDATLPPVVAPEVPPAPGVVGSRSSPRLRAWVVGAGVILLSVTATGLGLWVLRSEEKGRQGTSMRDARVSATRVTSSSPDGFVQTGPSLLVDGGGVVTRPASARSPRHHAAAGRVTARPHHAQTPVPRASAGAAAPGGVWVVTRRDGRLQWAAVLLDGREVGRSPLRIPGLSPGAHRVEIRRKGYRSETRRVVVSSGHELRVFFELGVEP